MSSIDGTLQRCAPFMLYEVRKLVDVIGITSSSVISHHTFLILVAKPKTSLTTFAFIKCAFIRTIDFMAARRDVPVLDSLRSYKYRQHGRVIPP